MKKAIICVKKSMTDSYVGGVITIINHYLSHAKLFEANGYETTLFNHQMKRTLKTANLIMCCTASRNAVRCLQN